MLATTFTKKRSIFWCLLLLLSALEFNLTPVSAQDLKCEVKFEVGTYDNLRGECSGNGVCNRTTGKCECDAGYTGRSDWLNTEGLDCQLNIGVVNALWGINAGLAVIFQFIVVPKMWGKWQDYQAKKKHFAAQGKKIHIRHNRGLVAIMFYEFYLFPMLLIFSILKWSLPDERVGITFTITLFFALVKTGFYVGIAYMFQPALIRTLLTSRTLKNNDQVKKLLALGDFFALLNAVSSVVLSFVPFITFGNGGKLDGTAEFAWLLYQGGMILNLSAYFLQSVYLRHKIISVLDGVLVGNKSVGVAETKKKLVGLQHTIMFQAGLQTCLYGLFTFWPYLWNRHDYFLPASWIAFILIGKNIAETHIRSSKGSKTGGDSKLSSKGDSSKMLLSGGSAGDDSTSFMFVTRAGSDGSFKQTKSPAPPTDAPVSAPPLDLDE